MHTTSLRKVGGSTMMAIPPAILDLLHLEAGLTVGLAVEGDRLVVQARIKPRDTLDELLAQCDPAAPFSAEDFSWLETVPSGLEL